MTEQEQVQPTPEVSQEVEHIADVTSGAFLDMWSVRVIDGKQYKTKIGLSVRDADPVKAFSKLVEAVAELEKKYKGFTPYNPDEFRVVVNKTDPQPQVPATPAAPAPAGAKAAPAPAPVTPAPAATPATGGGAVEVNRVTVTPNAEGKVKIEFWKTGRKYAELYATWTPEYASEMFSKLDASWTVDKFAKAVAYDATFTAEWVNGRPNPKGTPYKDIVDLRP
jgi:hypothetical protein